MKNGSAIHPFFLITIISGLFLLAGPASPLLVIVLVSTALVGAKFYRRIAQAYSAAHFPLGQGNPSQREKPDRFSGQQLENRSDNIRNKISDARKRLIATP